MSILHGSQPIETLLTELGISNGDLVAVSPDQLSYKALQKARKGRALTPRMQSKILVALRLLTPERNFSKADLFNY